MSNRVCGGCTACCKVFPILSIRKPGGEWCPKCDIGKGCRIYNSRPVECVDYLCLWRQGLDTEEDRPDKRKVLVEHARIAAIGGAYALIFWEVSVGGLDSAYIQNMSRRLRRNLKPYAYVYLTKRQTVYLPVSFPITPVIRSNLERDKVELETYLTIAA